MSTRTEALKSLRTAADRCHGNIPLSEETAKALGLKARSISKEDALDLLDQETESDESEAEADPAPNRKKPVRNGKVGKPVASDGPVDPDPLG